MKRYLTKEWALIIEALIALHLMNWLLGFELTVLIVLCVLGGHIFKMSWKIE
jgi:hypothetical protein